MVAGHSVRLLKAVLNDFGEIIQQSFVFTVVEIGAGADDRVYLYTCHKSNVQATPFISLSSNTYTIILVSLSSFNNSTISFHLTAKFHARRPSTQTPIYAVWLFAPFFRR